MPKSDRGLLTFKDNKRPGPGEYKNEEQGMKVLNKAQTFASPKATRDICFSRYNAVHNELIRNGIY